MLSSITRKAQDFSRWIGRQVVDNDFGTTDKTTRDYAVIGATAGAVVGATVGTKIGFDSQATNSIEEVWVDRNVTHPEMNGYSHYTVPVTSTDCTTDYEGNQDCVTTIDGYWHHYSPNITNRVVGHYTEPTFQNTNFLEPLMGGLLGAVGGGALGLAAGIGAAALQRSFQEKSGKSPQTPVRLEPETKSRLTTRTGAMMLGGAAMGVGLGAYFGTQAGSIELASQQVHTRGWDIPVTKPETLGYIPYSHYQPGSFPFSFSRTASDPVVRQVPVYDRVGDPTFTGTSRTFETNRYGPVFGGIVGGLMGGGVGLAAGIALGVTDKMMTERSVQKAQQKKVA